MRDRICITTSEASVPPRPRRKTAVIVDDGRSVELVLLEVSRPATVGTRFTHSGRSWMVSGVRRGSGVLVAEPISRDTSLPDVAPTR